MKGKVHNEMSIQNLNRSLSSSVYIYPFLFIQRNISLVVFKKYYLSLFRKGKDSAVKESWLQQAGRIIALQLSKPLSLGNIKNLF